MPGVEVLHPDGNSFDRFLFATVGEDRNGASVTVVSALARLGLEPWNEAADLAALQPPAALARLEMLLSDFGDVPALEQDHGSVAAKLVSLLPEVLPRRVSVITGSTETGLPSVSIRWILAAVLLIAGLLNLFASAWFG